MNVKPMYLLDTDHISLIARGGAEGQRILRRLSVLPPNEVAVSIVSYEEQMRGWLAEIAAARTLDRQETKYHELGRMLKYYCATPILPFEGIAITAFQNLWLQRLRIGTMDLKIAAIALANDATLLTRNLADFHKVPDCRAAERFLHIWTLSRPHGLTSFRCPLRFWRQVLQETRRK
jgi:tRNA(fMet)-specific endonuclease VapC